MVGIFCQPTTLQLTTLRVRHLLQRGEPHASRLNGGNLRTALAPQRSGSPTTNYEQLTTNK
ncbi:MAG: hypothetical protein KME31_10625 [Tolypothrix carrinoi HA7290-LM1]|nr:hypothetical protein [Tolypothrix carrinoi HA7290-LM1]